MVSEEASTMLLYRHIKSANDFKKGKWQSDEGITQDFTSRWDALIRYKCDPWKDTSIFNSQLGVVYSEYRGTTKTYSFDIGKTQTSHNMEPEDGVITAYMFLRFYEEMGIPFKVTNSTFSADSAKSAIERIAKYSPYWALATLVRIGDAKAISLYISYKIP